jgi:hypothetical protein
MRQRLLPALLALTPLACGDDAGVTPTTTDPGTSTGLDSSSSSSTTIAPESSGDPGESSSTDPDPSTSSSGVDSSSDDAAEGGAVCNNGVIEGNEDCDCGEFLCSAQSLDNKLCSDVDDASFPGPLTGGTLGCNQASCRFDTSMCSWCGDRIIGEHEECEPETPITDDCNELGKGSAGQVSCGTDCRYDVSECTDCGARFEFQGGGGCPYGFTVAKLDPDAAGVSWQCGNPSNYAGGPGIAVTGVYATNLIGEYNPHEISALVTPEIDLSSCAGADLELELVHWHNFEGGDDNSDGGIVQVSTNGTTWVTIAPASGELYGPTPIDATYPPVQGVVGFSGQSEDEEWHSSVFDLSDYAGEDSVQVRMVMGSDENTQLGGWYIDTLEVRGS